MRNDGVYSLEVHRGNDFMGTAETYLVVNLSGMFRVFDIEGNVLTNGAMTLSRKLNI